MTTQTNLDLAGLVGTWKLNAERTSVGFRTRALWIIPAKGTLQAIRGSAQVGADGRVSGEIVLDPASVDTKTKKRDDHLRSADYFDIVHHPTITFTVTDVRTATTGELEVTGNLDVHGQSTKLALLADVALDADSATVSTEAVINRGMLGMKKRTPAKSWVTVHAQFDRPQP
jgi:polyisoprenoid-binding protein YceI